MKKISILFAMLVAVISLNSCKDDTYPRFNPPTVFELNTPALANEYYELTEEGTVNLSWSQPNYSYAAAATYAVQVSLAEDFADFKELSSTYVVCDAHVKSKEIAEAICILRGIDSEEAYVDEPARKLYVRVRAFIDGIEGSEILSNVIVLNQVKEYCAIQSPGYIYLIGNVGGWTGPDAANAGALADWRLFESDNAIGSKIYSGVFDMPAGELIFRFYTELTGWDGGASVGLQAEDNPIDVTLIDGAAKEQLVAPGKGSIRIPEWEGGAMKIVVNMNDLTVTLEAGGVDTNGKAFIYLVGAPSGWTQPSEANAAHYETWKLYDLEDNGVYTATFDIPAESFQFRFYKELTDWDGGASYGSQVEDAPIDITMTDGVFAGDATDGKGSWNLPGWEGGKVAISVDTKNNKVTFTKK